MSSRTPSESALKSIESEDDTRNPTTQKKVYHPTPAKPYPLYRSPQQHLLRHQQLQLRKSRHLNQRRYNSAQRIQAQISSGRSRLRQQQLDEMIQHQKEERRAISAAHKREMQYLERTWKGYFERVREKEVEILRDFKMEQYREIGRAKQRLERKCQSLRNRSRESTELRNKEKYYVKIGDFDALRHIKKQIKKANSKHKKERAATIERWTRQEQQQLGIHQQRKYTALMYRLQENHNDKERVYLREQRRLRQKYKNVVGQLKHEQTMERVAWEEWY